MPETAKTLLDRPMPDDYRQEATARVGSTPTVSEARTESAVIFRICTEWLALSTMTFQGVSEPKLIHSLPHRRDGVVLGLANLRGELLICVSLATLLNVTTAAQSQPTGQGRGERLVLVHGSSGRFLVPVHEVYGIHRYLREELHEAPATPTNAAIRYTVGILSWRERVVARLDDELVFHMLAKALA